ncbi:MAG: S26 family signal peptidase [Bacteroidota bacterium]
MELDKANPRQKSVVREWTEAIVFAVFAATFIRMFLIEAYTIPTPSMENSLKVGDFLFVSKINYGSRMPMTPLSFPLVHNRMPFTGGESYTKAVQWDYKRIKGFQDIKLMDPVVFNFPEGDTIAIASAALVAQNPYEFKDRTHYYDFLRRRGRSFVYRNFKVLARPVDKKDNYIKRCVGLPGNTIEIKEGQLYIDGEEAQNPEGMQMMYRVLTSGVEPNPVKLKEWGIQLVNTNQGLKAHLDDTQLELLSGLDGVTSVIPDLRTLPVKSIAGGGSVFPHDPVNFPWAMDKFGPLTIPKMGETVAIGPKNIALYEKLIRDYEGNDLQIEAGRILINGEEAREYTFKMDYYWMMGDNRHNSEDSRVWGFVPVDHIVGKPLFIWLSLENGRLFDGTDQNGNPVDGGIRFDRMFKSATKE